PWASLDAAVAYQRTNYREIVGGTSDGYLFELRLLDDGKLEMRPRGKPFAQGNVQGMALVPGREVEGKKSVAVVGVVGERDGMPRGFLFSSGASTAAVSPGGIPHVDRQLSMSGFGAITSDDKGTVWAGEHDRIGRLVRYSAQASKKPKDPPKP